MLGTKSKPKTEVNALKGTNGTAQGNETCVVSKGTSVEGKFISSENVRLDGSINGEVKCDSRLVVGKEGRIKGDVVTQDAIVMGTIEGEVKVSGTLTLKGTALIRGGINAKYLVVEEGARYIGDCTIGG